MRVYEIYTQRKRMRKVRRVLNRFFKCYTISRTEGCWNGTRERAICVRIMADGQGPHVRERVNAAAEEIREINGQESVLVANGLLHA